MAYNIGSAFHKVLLWCLIAVILSNEFGEAEAILEAFGGCKRYCHDDLRVSSYDCFFFCLYRCTPSIGGGCDDYDTPDATKADDISPSTSENKLGAIAPASLLTRSRKLKS